MVLWFFVLSILFMANELHAQTESLESETTILPLEEILKSSETTSESTITFTTSSSTSTSTTTTLTTSRYLPEGFAFNRSQFELGHYCTCDLTDVCDVNCCCDTDCSMKDLRAFIGCKEVVPHNFDSRYCFTTEIVVENNTQFLLQKVNADPLFCITDTNLEEAFTYIDPEPITNVTRFEDMKTRHEAFLWPLKAKKPQNGHKNESHYSVDDPIVIINNGMEFSYLSLPVPSIGSSTKSCDTYSPVRYMEKSNQKCQMKLTQETDCREIPELNAANFMNDLKIVKNIKAIQNVTIEDILDNDDLFVVPKPNVCINLGTGERVVCVKVKQNEALSEPTKNCENILTKLIYEIHHDGNDGIKEVQVLIEMTNFSPRLTYPEDHVVFTQTFGYNHYWSSDNVTSTLKEKSGNPGYLVGKPIRSGVMTIKEDAIVLNEELSALTQSELVIDRGLEEMSQFLTIMDTKGDCNNYDRKKIGFKINERVGCVMYKTRNELSETCHTMKKHAIDLLVGNHLSRIRRNNNRDGRNIIEDFGLQLILRQRVSMFGNSKTTDPQDWVQILVSNPPNYEELEVGDKPNNLGECKDIVRNLHIQIYYANVGSIANPQSKIIGVHYFFSPPEDLNFNCYGLHCRQVNATQGYEFSTSVNFVDMTQPALSYFKETPVIEAKLPHDFFYPFLRTYSASKCSGLEVNYSIILLALVIVFKTWLSSLKNHL